VAPQVERACESDQECRIQELEVGDGVGDAEA
jgi:hypothetical protein